MILFIHPLNNLVFIFAAEGGAEVEAEYLGDDGAQYAEDVEHHVFHGGLYQVVAEDDDIEQGEGEQRARHGQQGTDVFGDPRGVGARLYGRTALAGTVDVLQYVFLFFHAQSFAV